MHLYSILLPWLSEVQNWKWDWDWELVGSAGFGIFCGSTRFARSSVLDSTSPFPSSARLRVSSSCWNLQMKIKVPICQCLSEGCSRARAGLWSWNFSWFVFQWVPVEGLHSALLTWAELTVRSPAPILAVILFLHQFQRTGNHF